MRGSDPLYGYWFFEAYYQAFAKQLSAISRKFVPETEAGVDELLTEPLVVPGRDVRPLHWPADTPYLIRPNNT